MLKVKRTTYGPGPAKTEDFVKLRTEIKEYQNLLEKMNTLKENLKNMRRKKNSTAAKQNEKTTATRSTSIFSKKQQRKYRRYESSDDSNDLQYFDHKRNKNER